jgi:hypothetical protein
MLFCLSTNATSNTSSIKSWPGFKNNAHQFFQNKFYFIGSSAEHSYALWVIDDYEKPPRLITDLYPDATNEYKFSFRSDDSKNLYITMSVATVDITNKAELWSVDVKTESVNRLLMLNNTSDKRAKIDLIGELLLIENKVMFMVSSINDVGEMSQVVYESDGTLLGTKPSSLFKHSEFVDLFAIEEEPLLLAGYFRGRFYFTRAYYQQSSFDENHKLKTPAGLFYFSQNKLQSDLYDSSWFKSLGFNFTPISREVDIRNKLFYIDGQLFNIIKPSIYAYDTNEQAIASFTLLKDFYQTEDYTALGSIVYKHDNKLFYFDKGYNAGGRSLDITSNVHVLDLNSGINSDLGQWYSDVLPLYESSLGWNNFEVFKVGLYFKKNYYFNLGLGPFHGYGNIGDTFAPELSWTDGLSPLTEFVVPMPNATNISVTQDILLFNSDDQLWISDGTVQGTHAFFLENSQLIATNNDVSLIEQVVDGHSHFWLGDLTIDNTIKVLEFPEVISDISEYLTVGSKVIYKVSSNMGKSFLLLDWTQSKMTLLQDTEETLGNSNYLWYTQQCVAVSYDRSSSELIVISLTNEDDSTSYTGLPLEKSSVTQFDSTSFTINLSNNMEWQVDKSALLGDVLLTQQGNVLKVTYRSYETIGQDIISLRLKNPTCATNHIKIPIEVTNKDSDNDGMDDGFEYVYGFNRLINDTDMDLDQDGLSNLSEYLLGTRPDLADTDSDGVTDNEDAFPLDVTKSAKPTIPEQVGKSSGGSMALFLLLLLLFIGVKWHRTNRNLLSQTNQ